MIKARRKGLPTFEALRALPFCHSHTPAARVLSATEPLRRVRRRRKGSSSPNAVAVEEKDVWVRSSWGALSGLLLRVPTLGQAGLVRHLGCLPTRRSVWKSASRLRPRPTDWRVWTVCTLLLLPLHPSGPSRYRPT